MVRIGKEDVIIGISFPRYSMRTLKAMEFANNCSAKVITLTDSVHSPMNLYSSQSDQTVHSVYCGFTGCTTQRDQCPSDRGTLYEKQRDVAKTLEMLVAESGMHNQVYEMMRSMRLTIP